VGGVLAHINTATAALRERGFTVRVVTPIGVGDKVPLLPSGANQRLKNLLNGWLLVASLTAALVLLRLRLLAQLRAHPGAIVHAHDALAALACPRSTPLILTIHGYLAKELRSDGKVKPGSGAEAQLTRWETSAYRRANRVIAVDESIAHHITAMSGVADVLVQPNAVQIGSPVPGSVRQARRQTAGVTDDTSLVLIPRRLVHKNGPFVPMEALCRLPEADRARLRLVYAGQGPLMEELAARVHSLKLDQQVRFLGAVDHDDMPSWYAAADLVLVPSVEHSGVVEATSIAALEAMGAGTPLIASEIGGLREIIRHGETGCLVPGGDAEALAKELSAFLDQPAAFAGRAERARQFVEEHFSLGALADRYARSYREL
jgi:glycosyltransferase involved in cell wall biosynthesis